MTFFQINRQPNSLLGNELPVISVWPLSKCNISNNISSLKYTLTHLGRVPHICVNKLTIIGSDNGLSPGRRQAIIWTNAGILLIGPLGTNFSEIAIKIHIFSFKKMHLKKSSREWRPFCLGLNVLIHIVFDTTQSYWESAKINVTYTHANTYCDQ